jgi:hypothetical protein
MSQPIANQSLLIGVTLVMLATVVVLMIMMVRFVMLVVITGLRRRTTSSSDYRASQTRSVHFSFLSGLLDDTDFSKHQKIVAIFHRVPKVSLCSDPDHFFLHAGA